MGHNAARVLARLKYGPTWDAPKPVRKAKGRGRAGLRKRAMAAALNVIPPGGTVVTIPLRTVSEANARDGWYVTAKRKRLQDEMVTLFVSRLDIPRPPLCVRMVRIGGKPLDDDNLTSAFKRARDSIAKVIGIDDGRDDLVTYSVDQEPGRGPLAVRIEISQRSSNTQLFLKGERDELCNDGNG